MSTEIDELPEGDTFDRAYVEKLRTEAAKYRTSLRPFEDAFGDFNDDEKAYLFDLVKTLNNNPADGAIKFRDMAKNILGDDDFYQDLEVPEKPLPEEDDDEDTDKATDDKKEDQVSLTTEQMEELLNAREAKQAEEAAAKADEAEQEAAVEAVFAEIEAAGFVRDTEEFMTALTLGQSLANAGKEVDFNLLAPKVRQFHDLPEPDAVSADGDNTEVSADGDKPEGSGKEHAKTVGAGGSGGAAEPAKDWIAEAKASGKSPMEAARERMEARMDA